MIAASGGIFSNIGGWQTGRPRCNCVWRMLIEDGKQRGRAIVIGWVGKYKRLALWLVHGFGGNSSTSQPPRSTSHDHIQTSSPRRIAFRRQVHTETTRVMRCLAYCAMHKLDRLSTVARPRHMSLVFFIAMPCHPWLEECRLGILLGCVES